MPVVKSVVPDDPFAGLAWRACLANLALQKIRLRIPLNSEEREALKGLSRDVSDLITGTHQGVTAPLFKLGKRPLKSDLDQLRENLGRVVERISLPAVSMDDVLLERMQEIISKLIERVNSFRPQPDRFSLITCVA